MFYKYFLNEETKYQQWASIMEVKHIYWLVVEP